MAKSRSALASVANVVAVVMMLNIIFGAAAISLPGGSDSASPSPTSCYCNRGNVDVASPQCLCSCYDGYLLPHCLYTADQNATMEVWVRQNPSDFYSNLLLQAIAWGACNNNATNLRFLYAFPVPQYNRTVAFITMKGVHAQQLLWDYYSNNSWLAVANIESVWEYYPKEVPEPTYGASLKVYRSVDGKVYITIEMIMWLIAAAVVCVGVAMVDCCFLTNDEDAITERLLEEHPQMSDLVNGSLMPVAGPPTAGGNGSRPSSGKPSKSNKVYDDPRQMFTDRSRR